jgi:hypothetical protein
MEIATTIKEDKGASLVAKITTKKQIVRQRTNEFFSLE